MICWQSGNKRLSEFSVDYTRLLYLLIRQTGIQRGEAALSPKAGSFSAKLPRSSPKFPSRPCNTWYIDPQNYTFIQAAPSTRHSPHPQPLLISAWLSNTANPFLLGFTGIRICHSAWNKENRGEPRKHEFSSSAGECRLAACLQRINPTFASI